MRLQILPGAVAAYPPDQLTENPAERAGVVAVLAAGLPVGSLGCDSGDHGIPCQHLLEAERPVYRGQTGLVRQHHADGDLLLAVTAKLRPVMRHRQVHVQASGFNQLMDTGCRGALGR